MKEDVRGPRLDCDVVCSSLEILSNDYDDTLAKVQAMASALEAKYPYNRAHSDRVVAIAEAVADELGLDGEDRSAIVQAAELHDLGKIAVPGEILTKPAKLTAQEREVVQRHPWVAACLLSRLLYSDQCISLVYHHHEWYNGGGYPTRRTGGEIPLGSRVIAVADAFDAMTSDRPYRKAMPLQAAQRELENCAGTQFDPEVVDALFKACHKKRVIAD
ncbi:MAG: HD-GYP domain-containing protein [Chloroflexi bacterium]|nr:HD-GYP domain-containing protein [Chloroflexota bacterium]